MKAQIAISKEVLSLDLSLHEGAGSAAFMLPRIDLSGEMEYFQTLKTTHKHAILASASAFHIGRVTGSTRKERNKLARGNFNEGLI